MATLSSHVLDSVLGDHAKHIRISCNLRTDGQADVELFNVISDEQGRIAEEINVPVDTRCELVFHTADYFTAQPNIPNISQIVDAVTVQVRIKAPNERIHIPMMLAPHSYSIWWSA